MPYPHKHKEHSELKTYCCLLTSFKRVKISLVPKVVRCNSGNSSLALWIVICNSATWQRYNTSRNGIEAQWRQCSKTNKDSKVSFGGICSRGIYNPEMGRTWITNSAKYLSNLHVEGECEQQIFVRGTCIWQSRCPPWRGSTVWGSHRPSASHKLQEITVKMQVNLQIQLTDVFRVGKNTRAHQGTL